MNNPMSSTPSDGPLAAEMLKRVAMDALGNERDAFTVKVSVGAELLHLEIHNRLTGWRGILAFYSQLSSEDVRARVENLIRLRCVYGV
jgi:hypothetical protein